MAPTLSQNLMVPLLELRQEPFKNIPGCYLALDTSTAQVQDLALLPVKTTNSRFISFCRASSRLPIVNCVGSWVLLFLETGGHGKLPQKVDTDELQKAGGRYSRRTSIPQPPFAKDPGGDKDFGTSRFRAAIPWLL